MEREISSASILGIVLIALACVIGLGFGVFAIAKNTANEGVTNVQEGLQTVSDSSFVDYDQKIVTGTQVMSCYNNFNGKNVAVLISTIATKDQLVLDDGDVSDGSGVTSAYGTAWDKGAPLVPSGLKIVDSDGVQTTEELCYINYNALIGKLENPTTGEFSTGMEFDTNCYRTDKGFLSENGKVKFNNVSMNLSKSGMMEYVPSGSRFQAYLIKDKSGTIMGIAFEQISAGR